MNFDELKLAPAILKAVHEQGYATPTPIQAQAVPAALQAWRGSHVVITTIMLNSIASQLIFFVVMNSEFIQQEQRLGAEAVPEQVELCELE